MVKRFEGSLEYIRHDHDSLIFIPSGGYLVVEGTSHGKMDTSELRSYAPPLKASARGRILKLIQGTRDFHRSRIRKLGHVALTRPGWNRTSNPQLRMRNSTMSLNCYGLL
jgi:hypothetical protein